MKEPSEKQAFREQAYELVDDYKGKGTGKMPTKFGLCSTCDDFNYAAYKYGKEQAQCGYSDAMRRWPNGENPVIQCARYTERGRPSLSEMTNLAWFINVNEKKMGFKV